MLGSAFIMIMLGVCSPSRTCMTLATAYFILVDTITVASHLEVSRCVDKSLVPYVAITGIISTLFLLALIVSLMYLTKNHAALFRDSKETLTRRTFQEDLE